MEILHEWKFYCSPVFVANPIRVLDVYKMHFVFTVPANPIECYPKYPKNSRTLLGGNSVEPNKGKNVAIKILSLCQSIVFSHKFCFVFHIHNNLSPQC